MNSIQNISLRRATRDDIGVLIALEKTAAHKTYAAMTDEQEWQTEMEKGTIYLIQKGDITVGNISFQIKESDHAYLSGLMILSDYQGQGIAREAMTQVMEELKDIKRVDLVTHPHNTPAIMLYLSLGFKVESWKDNYFGDGEPRIVLSYLK
ncbi:MAG: putative acetyltransferase [Parcubacteria group bacterium Gr01-1014_33]|nr:MAG: putative acetyltransferase [Parcubacteria group bacterium Gr01-1014_33]